MAKPNVESQKKVVCEKLNFGHGSCAEMCPIQLLGTCVKTKLVNELACQHYIYND